MDSNRLLTIFGYRRPLSLSRALLLYNLILHSTTTTTRKEKKESQGRRGPQDLLHLSLPFEWGSIDGCCLSLYTL